jgi:hypothetical protein
VRILLRRRAKLPRAPYTGPASCGCRFLNGDHMVPCREHTDLVVASTR